MSTRMVLLSSKAPVALSVSIAIAIAIILLISQSLNKKPHHSVSSLETKTKTSIKYDLEEQISSNSSINSNSNNNNNNNSKEDRLWMNSGGLPYRISNAPNFDTEWILKDPTVKFFDVYSKPIRTLYSQVHWTNHGNIPLPDEIVQRYSSSNGDNDTKNPATTDTIAIVGYEADQVRIDPHTNLEVPVPITWAYDHHYMAFLMGEKETGEKTSMLEVPTQTAMEQSSSSKAYIGHMAAAGASKVWIPGTLNNNNNNNNNNSPMVTQGASDHSSSFFSEANGGESRKSYHSYPKGYAQLIRKPHSFSLTPMQIDVWNRDTMDSSEFVPPPLDKIHDYFPRSSNISARLLENLAEAKYNPLLECPCTDRLPKTWDMTYKMVPKDKEEDKPQEEGYIENADECFDAANQLGLSGTTIHNTIVPGTNKEGGSCEAVLRSDGSLEVLWRTKSNTQHVADIITAHSKETVTNGLMVGSTPTGSLINATLVVNATSKTVEITLKGPYLEEEDSERWFAIGFGARSMCKRMTADECISGGPYAVVVLPPTKDSPSLVVERKLDYHGPGRVLTNLDYGLKVLSNDIVIEGEDSGTEQLKRRIVRLVRPLKAPNDDYYSFALQVSELETSPLDIILAKGCPGTTRFGQHCGHQSPHPISFSKVDQWQAIHRDGIKGKLNGNFFGKECSDQPVGDLAKQGNPTCKLETYQGGLACCIHDHFLLDANQTVPWKDKVLDYRFKFRFYYQDYIEGTSKKAKTTMVAEPMTAATTPGPEKASHLDLPRMYWQTEMRAGEYDIPECKTPEVPSSCVHVITSRWKVREFSEWEYFPKEDETAGVELVYAGPHCHAPTCLSMELYNDDTGELLCSVEPLRGKGRDKLNDSNHKEDYDEEGFLAIPPCMWSRNADDGLPSTVFLSHNTTLLSIKKANSTFLHTGDMASWQMRGVFAHSKTNTNINIEEPKTSTEEDESKDEADIVSAERAHGRLRKT